jgi:hypothetical protein
MLIFAGSTNMTTQREPNIVRGVKAFESLFGCLGVAVFAVLFFSATYAIWHVVVLDHRKRVPAYLQVSKVLYVKEESWGFGPGGNETGLLVYELPADVAAAIGGKGLSFLTDNDNALKARQQLVPNFEWYATPVAPDFGWKGDGHTPPSISLFLNRYGFGLDFDQRFIAMADQAKNASGNFYSYGSGGRLLIVSPALRRVIFAYSG